jgi:hypothetical protein
VRRRKAGIHEQSLVSHRQRERFGPKHCGDAVPLDVPETSVRGLRTIIGGYRSQLVGDIIAFAIQVTAEAN